MKTNISIFLTVFMTLLLSCQKDNTEDNKNDKSNILSYIPTDKLKGWDSGVLINNKLYVMTHKDNDKGIVIKYINFVEQDSSTGITMFFDFNEKPFYTAIGENTISVSPVNDSLAFYLMINANTFQGIQVKGVNNSVTRNSISKSFDWKFGLSLTLIAGDAMTKLRDAINQWKYNNQNSGTFDFGNYNQYTSYTPTGRTDYPYINVCESPQDTQKKYNDYINKQKEFAQDDEKPEITNIIGTDKETTVYVKTPNKISIAKEFKWVAKDYSEIRRWKENLYINAICKEEAKPYIYNYDLISENNMCKNENEQLEFPFPILNECSTYHFRPYIYYKGNSPLYGINDNRQAIYGEEKLWSNIGDIKSFSIEENPPYTNDGNDIWAGCYFMPKIEIKASMPNSIENIKEWGVEVSCGYNKQRKTADNKNSNQKDYIFNFDDLHIGHNDLNADYYTHTATAPVNARIFIISKNDETIYGNTVQRIMKYNRKPSIKFTSTGVKNVFCKKCGKNVLQPYWNVHANGTFWMDETKYIEHGIGMIWQNDSEYTESDFYIGDGAGGDDMQFGYNPDNTINECYKHFRYGLIRSKEIHYVFKIKSKETSSDNAIILHWKNRETRNEESIITSSTLGTSTHQNSAIKE